jgi:hypothetical protein
VISGAGGLGKTWLAVRWATDNVTRFPDGQLYVDLRGFDPAHEPVPAARVLRGFLGALGVAGRSIPSEPGELAALYRSLTARRRLLVLLDNARDTEHVIPLLPGGSSCSVLVTSRHGFGGLLTHGASALPLRTLDERQARELLAQKVGAASLAEEPEAGQEIQHRMRQPRPHPHSTAQPGPLQKATGSQASETNIDMSLTRSGMIMARADPLSPGDRGSRPPPDRTAHHRHARPDRRGPTKTGYLDLSATGEAK